MKRKSVVLSLLLYLSICGYANTDPNKYQYTVDLTRVEDDKLLVVLKTPIIESSAITFYFPKIIPGTYKIADYGRFVSDLKAYNKKGKELPVSRIDDNTWNIEKANKMRKLTYLIDDTYDFDMGENQIYPMAGSNIEKGKNFVISTPAFFGYFDGMKQLEFDIRVIRPENFYGATGLIAETDQKLKALIKEEGMLITDEGKQVDYYKLTNYNELMDSPLMYNAPDTSIINVGGTEILISVYSPNGMVQSNYVAENIREILMAQKEFLGGKLPVDKYAFIFYMEEPSKLASIQGALEHSYSSFYYFPEVPQEHLKQTLRDVVAHEFFHIVTPLNIHSEEIHYFDYNDPKMSEHLWMYEGMTEYFAGNVQVKYNIIDHEQYLKMIRQKMVNATNQFNDTLPFTDLSKYTLTKYPDQYGNVYQKGALIGMCLDIKLRHLSDGKYGVQNMMKDLSKKFGKNTAFQDDELFGVIESLTYPEIGDFLTAYVSGSNPLPYEEIFDLVGVDYLPEENYTDFTLGSFGIGFNPEINRIFVNNISNLNQFGKALGYQNGDILLKLAGEEIPIQPGLIRQFIDNVKSNLIEDEEFTVTVIRKDEDDNDHEVQLRAKTTKVELKRLHQIKFLDNPTPEQIAIRDAWLKPQTN